MASITFWEGNPISVGLAFAAVVVIMVYQRWANECRKAFGDDDEE